MKDSYAKILEIAPSLKKYKTRSMAACVISNRIECMVSYPGDKDWYREQIHGMIDLLLHMGYISLNSSIALEQYVTDRCRKG